MWFSALIFFAETFVGKGPLIHLFILKYIHLNLQINIPLFNLKIKKNYSKAESGEITSKKKRFVCYKQVNVMREREKKGKKDVYGIFFCLRLFGAFVVAQ